MYFKSVKGKEQWHSSLPLVVCQTKIAINEKLMMVITFTSQMIFIIETDALSPM